MPYDPARLLRQSWVSADDLARELYVMLMTGVMPAPTSGPALVPDQRRVIPALVPDQRRAIPVRYGTPPPSRAAEPQVIRPPGVPRQTANLARSLLALPPLVRHQAQAASQPPGVVPEPAAPPEIRRSLAGELPSTQPAFDVDKRLSYESVISSQSSPGLEPLPPAVAPETPPGRRQPAEPSTPPAPPLQAAPLAPRPASPFVPELPRPLTSSERPLPPIQPDSVYQSFATAPPPREDERPGQCVEFEPLPPTETPYERKEVEIPLGSGWPGPFPRDPVESVDVAIFRTDSSGISAFSPPSPGAQDYGTPGTGQAYYLDYDPNEGTLQLEDGQTEPLLNIGPAIAPNTTTMGFLIDGEFYWPFPVATGIFACICPVGGIPAGTPPPGGTMGGPVTDVAIYQPSSSGSYTSVGNGSVFNGMPDPAIAGRLLYLAPLDSDAYLAISQACK